MFYKLILVASILALATSQCQPLYWETDPAYDFRTTELDKVAMQPLYPHDISDPKGISKKKTTYTISNIIGKITYDNSSQTVDKIGNIIYVNGSRFNIAFTYDLSAGKYKGNATASLNGVVFNYTKTPRNINGNTSYDVYLKLLTVPTILPANDTSGNATDEEKQKFYSLVQVNLTQDVKYILNSNLPESIKEAARLSYNFDSKPYKYTYASGINESFTVQMNTSVTKYIVFEQRGYLLGYNGTVNGQNTICSTYTPTDFTKKASFFPVGFIKNLYLEFLAKFPAWKNFTVNQNNAKSSYFGFRVIDLDSITPSYINKHPNLTYRIQARCVIDSDLAVEIQLDPISNEVKTTAGWTCGMFGVEDNVTILSFYTLNQYKLQVRQEDTKLMVQISGVAPKSTKWNAEESFPIVNEKLADLYLREIVTAFNGQSTLGTGFMQPERTTPKVIVWDEAVQIYDAATQIER